MCKALLKVLKEIESLNVSSPKEYSDKQKGELNWQIIMEQNNDRCSNRGTNYIGNEQKGTLLVWNLKRYTHMLSL